MLPAYTSIFSASSLITRLQPDLASYFLRNIKSSPSTVQFLPEGSSDCRQRLLKQPSEDQQYYRTPGWSKEPKNLSRLAPRVSDGRAALQTQVASKICPLPPLGETFLAPLCRKTLDDMSTTSSATPSLSLRKPCRFGNSGDRAYIKHVRHKYYSSTSVEVIAAPGPSQQEGKSLDNEGSVLATQDTKMYQSLSGRSTTAPTSLKLHGLSKIVVSSGPWASDSDTHTVRSNTANPLTRKSYDTITGSDETTIHAGDHFGDYYDHRTTFNTARKNNLTWAGIGADTLSRTVAGLALNALSW